MRKLLIRLLIGLIVILILTLGCWTFYNLLNRQRSGTETAGDNIYRYHYTLITHSKSAALWNTVYESAKAKAAEQGAYLEHMQVDSSENYTLEDYLRICIASNVDGIILESDGSDSVDQLINKAQTSEPEIPVITILEDSSTSLRESFVGVNSYQLGQGYGEAVLELITEETQKVVVMLNESESVAKNVIYTQIKNIISEQYGDDTIQVESFLLKEDTPFDSEEQIRNLLLDPDTTPDILVCLNQVDTEGAYQSLVDYNKVGQVAIVGYHLSDSITAAIERGSIPAVFELDAVKLGEYSVQALSEYLATGRVNAYFNVKLNKVTRENAELYLPSESTAAQNGGPGGL